MTGRRPTATRRCGRAPRPGCWPCASTTGRARCARRVILPAVLWLPFGGAPPKALAVASYRFFARAGDEKAPAARRRGALGAGGAALRAARRGRLPRLQGVREVARASIVRGHALPDSRLRRPTPASAPSWCSSQATLRSTCPNGESARKSKKPRCSRTTPRAIDVAHGRARGDDGPGSLQARLETTPTASSSRAWARIAAFWGTRRFLLPNCAQRRSTHASVGRRRMEELAAR